MHNINTQSNSVKDPIISFAPRPDVPRVRPLPFPLKVVVLCPRVLCPHRVLDRVPLVRLADDRPLLPVIREGLLCVLALCVLAAGLDPHDRDRLGMLLAQLALDGLLVEGLGCGRVGHLGAAVALPAHEMKEWLFSHAGLAKVRVVVAVVVGVVVGLLFDYVLASHNLSQAKTCTLSFHWKE